MKLNNIRTGVIIVCLLGIAVCLLLLIPQIRQTIIEMTEQLLMRRELRDHAKWHQILFRISITGTIFGGLFLFCSLFIHIIKKIQNSVYKYVIYMIKKLISYILKSYKYMNNEIQKVICKDIVISILCMFGLYTFAIISIIRADFLYIDDLGAEQ
jgi:hypothetical protein